MNAPFFSIIITTYNRAVLLNRAIRSLLSQSEKDWEAIIVNDGSTDDTLEQLNPFLKSTNKITIVTTPNNGAAASKNIGIRLAKGQYITFLDSDDEYEHSHLSSRKNTLIMHPEIDFLYGGAKIIGDQYVPDRFDKSQLIHLDKCVIGAAFFIKKSVFNLIQEFPVIPFGSDAAFFEQLTQLGVCFQSTDIKSYLYHREMEDSITKNFASH